MIQASAKLGLMHNKEASMQLARKNIFKSKCRIVKPLFSQLEFSLGPNHPNVPHCGTSGNVPNTSTITHFFLSLLTQKS